MLYDVIVVGSGPAGAVAASQLAKQNKSVLLIDQTTFPRDKVCGDGMPLNVMRILHDIGIDINKFGLEHFHIRNLSITSPSNHELLLTEKATQYYSMVAKREHFDAMLHFHALKMGAQFEVGRVVDWLYDGSNAVAGVAVSTGNTTQEYEARYVVLANGVASRLNKSFTVGDDGQHTIAIRAYGKTLRALDPTVKFYFLEKYLPGYAWLFPTQPYEVNVGVYLDTKMYKQKSINLNSIFHSFIDSLSSEYEIDIDPETVRTWGIPIYTTGNTRKQDNVFLVGDAGFLVNALTGGGIHSAIISGILAANCIIDKSDDYDARWTKELKGTLRSSYFLQQYIAPYPFLLSSLLQIGNFHFARSRIMRLIAGDHY